MIKFTLACDHNHRFESWFASSDAFDTLLSNGMISCVHCGSSKVEKSLMAPNVSTSRAVTAPLRNDITPQEKALAEMKRQVEDNADYVGLSFAKEAREMHEGTIPDRPIYGEANLKEAKGLIEDGVPVLPLPFMNKRKTN